MKMVKLRIDGQEIEVAEGSSVLEAARKAGIDIPTLCYLKDLNAPAACRVCIVQVEGRPTMDASCVLPVEEGMSVRTNTPEILAARKQILELLLSDHPFECLTCERNLNCELQRLAKRYGIRDLHLEGSRNHFPIDDLSPSVVREPDKCIRCRRCISVCKNFQAVSIYSMVERSFNAIVGPAYNGSLAETPCIYCGQCITVCPTGALREQDSTGRVWEALQDPDLHVIVQTAPSIRSTIGEEFGYPVGTPVMGQMVAALRRLGFDRVFDDCFGADVTVMEEATELIERLARGGPFPQFTSCCPSWVKFCESFYPELTANLSSVKSPQQVFGALAKTYYARMEGIDPARIFVVSVMPCVSKKYELLRPEMNSSGFRDVDAELTTRELVQMIFEAGLDLKKLPEETFDSPMGEASGAGIIFGSTGGVMEAALRTAHEWISGEELATVEFNEVRSEEYKDAEIQMGEHRIKVAVARGTGAARRLIEAILKGKKEYHFVEVMACPAGCVGGGGQPIYIETNDWNEQVSHRAMRAKGLHELDRTREIRKSHLNPSIKKLYDEFLEYPGSDIAKRLLHTGYISRKLYAPDPLPKKEPKQKVQPR
ncbi:MAG: 2Fe-2S iron-sulfur cluster binding domain-containing protein [Firmicutes bacterium]|jgi:NADH-quinone oxidoreductase subunit G/NADP-reducing hydrogenase subunit HndD|nr:2Fe-2S iron-sulfur cluster binding domain-containing protein [Bacillota bacterium]